MKNTIVSITLIIFTALQINAQDRSGILSAGEQSVGLATGMDYSILPAILSYNRGMDAFNFENPINVGLEATIPMYAFDLNDIRLKIVTDITVLRKRSFEIRAGINPVFINTKLQTETMSSLGVDLHVFVGITKEKWSYGGEATYNKIFTTHIKHTDKYRDLVFADAVDGWYKNTAGNIQAGIYVNRRIKKFDLSFRTGMSKTARLNEYLLVPTFYGIMGLEYRF